MLFARSKKKQTVAQMGFKVDGSAACMGGLKPAQLHWHSQAFARHMPGEDLVHRNPPGLPYPPSRSAPPGIPATKSQ